MRTLKSFGAVLKIASGLGNTPGRSSSSTQRYSGLPCVSFTRSSRRRSESSARVASSGWMWANCARNCSSEPLHSGPRHRVRIQLSLVVRPNSAPSPLYVGTAAMREPTYKGEGAEFGLVCRHSRDARAVRAGPPSHGRIECGVVAVHLEVGAHEGALEPEAGEDLRQLA